MTESTPPDTIRPGSDDTDALVEAVIEVADAVDELADEVRGGTAGIHQGLGAMHSDITKRFEGVENLINGLAANVRTALSVVPALNQRLSDVEKVIAHITSTPSSGTNGSAQQ